MYMYIIYSSSIISGEGGVGRGGAGSQQEFWGLAEAQNCGPQRLMQLGV